MSQRDEFEKALTKSLNDIGLFPVPRTVRAATEFAFNWQAKRIAGLEAQLNVATKLLDERKDQIERLKEAGNAMVTELEDWMDIEGIDLESVDAINDWESSKGSTE